VLLTHSEPLLAAFKVARDILERPQQQQEQSEGELALRTAMRAVLCTPAMAEIEQTYFPGARADRLRHAQLAMGCAEET
jgi:hypothetical protein